MISRTIKESILKSIKNKPVTLITGARQVGKSTLCGELKKELNTIKLENKIENIKVNLTQGSDYGGGFNPFKVYKLKNNIIKLSGLINCTLNETICQLPENCRPKGRLIFTTMANSNTFRVDILENGNVLPSGSGQGWLSFDGISFIAGQ